jgi:uncharacterized protein YjgD (DUF1641 family)
MVIKAIRMKNKKEIKSWSNKSVIASIDDILENVIRTEEILSTVVYFFTDLYNIENEFKKRMKYAFISKLFVFLSFQRSKSHMHNVYRWLEILLNKELIKDVTLKEKVAEIEKRLETVESNYNQEKYVGIIKELKSIDSECIKLKEDVKQLRNNLS